MFSFSFLVLRGFSSHLDQIGPQIQNKVLNMGGPACKSSATLGTDGSGGILPGLALFRTCSRLSRV